LDQISAEKTKVSERLARLDTDRATVATQLTDLETAERALMRVSKTPPARSSSRAAAEGRRPRATYASAPSGDRSISSTTVLKVRLAGASADAGEVDFAPAYALQGVRAIDAGEPLMLLAGVMVGCFELFAREGIDRFAELKGKSIGVGAAGSLNSQLVNLVMAQIGLDFTKDVQWVTDPKIKPKELFELGKIDAFLAFPPEPQDLRARHIGHVLVNTAVDRPWSQYFCCMLASNREFVAMHPVATKRVVRAILKATDLCATEPARAAQWLADRDLTARYDYTLQTLSENGYKWREYDAEDTIRFYALRLRDIGLIKSSPQKIIANGTDWRFLDELKRELKA
jgi:NitT/TauT family transport system substrate-binding protein